MSDAAYLKLWSYVASVQLVVMLALFAPTVSGSNATNLFGGVNVTASTVPALGLPVDLLLGILALVLTLGWSYPRRSKPRLQRVPTFHFAETAIRRATPAGKLYKAATLIGAHVLPLAACIQMYVRYFEGAVYSRGGNLVIPGGWSHFSYSELSKASERGMLWFGASAGLEHFAILPWIYAALGLAYLVLWIIVAWTIFQHARPLRNEGSEELVGLS